ncbi:hypothetical protein RUM44_012458 [Polyplax serrata]|uniref:Lysosomal Pro-X carboxypeptidase n=1 Tax=Polyplax serrata TaxID=468196 RepID=A0ABR1BF55_POLSC
MQFKNSVLVRRDKSERKSSELDHFSFANNITFDIRYLINDTYWKPGSGPIFFYTGNEGDIEVFAQNTGFMWEIAPKFRALVIFAEHRYYGKSLPFGNQSFSDPKHLGYLTSQQALADYVDLLTYIQTNSSRSYTSPVIAFGGSYGGMLSAYMRMKYPHIIAGSIASSAPLWSFTGLTPCDAFARIVTADFTAENKSCSKNVRRSWEIINNVTSKEEGLEWMSTEWKLCHPLKNKTDVDALKDWLADVYGTLAMLNYPYGTDFLTKLPGHPVREFCKSLQNVTSTGKDLLKELHKSVSVYFNYTGDQKCLNYYSISPTLGADMWDYQACSEMVMPMCQNGNTDMFEPTPWSLADFSESCMKQWKVKPHPYLAEKMYGGKAISSASNIMFSNGLLDPWTSGGVLKTRSKSIKIVLIPEAAHHLDLRPSNPADPDSVRKSRLLYQDLIKDWIREFDERFNSM